VVYARPHYELLPVAKEHNAAAAAAPAPIGKQAIRLEVAPELNENARKQQLKRESKKVMAPIKDVQQPQNVARILYAIKS